MNRIKRISFIKVMFAGAIALHLPFVFSCNSKNINTVDLIIGNSKYSINIYYLRAIIDVLLPQNNIAPSGTSFNADIYFLWLVSDNKLDEAKRVSLINSIERINIYILEHYSNSIDKLSVNKQNEAIENISMIDWGETALSLIMTVCFEAMFANPLYGSNTDYKGWNWLKYQGGIPQPNAENKYPEILSINHKE